jgi:8-oxo-dGTP pyrophosphatase MutT (NUDIX family)
MTEHVEELNPGSPTVPRPAASVILLRRGSKHDSRGLEILLGRRTPKASFMPNAWVFPGGAVDKAAAQEVGDAEYRATAIRELDEETSVLLDDPTQLVPFSRWITPREVKVRYDTWFYLALAPTHASPAPDGAEIVELSWFEPQDALDRGAAGELLLVFPTIKQLEALREFATAGEALETAGRREIVPILPKVSVMDGKPRILLPGDAGYDELD